MAASAAMVPTPLSMQAIHSPPLPQMVWPITTLRNGPLALNGPGQCSPFHKSRARYLFATKLMVETAYSYRT